MLFGSAPAYAQEQSLLLPEQEWTNAHGKKLTAAVVEIRKDKVVFWIDRREVVYSIAKLSSDSQVDLKEKVAKAKGGKEGELQSINFLCIRANFADRQMLVNNDELWRSRIQSLVDYALPYYQLQSHGKIADMKIDSTKVYLFPTNWADFRGKESELADAMRKLAQEDGWELSAYDHVVLSFPSIEGDYGALGSPGTIWMPGDNPWPPGFAHELGHAFGFGHANTWEGGDKSWPGVHDEGSDANFTMGSGEVGAAWNLPMKVKSKWIPESRIKRVVKASKEIYRIYQCDSVDLISKGDLGIRVQDFWISYSPEQTHWVKDGVARESVQQGVFVHTLHGFHTRLIDATPNSRKNPDRSAPKMDPFHDTKDAALTLGASKLELDNFANYPAYKVSIEPLRVGRTKTFRWIDVEVELEKKDVEHLLIAEDSFKYQADTPGILSGGTGWDGEWEMSKSKAIVAPHPDGLKQGTLETVLGGLHLKSSYEEKDTLTLSRKLSKSVGSPDSQLWVSVLVQPQNQQVGDLLISLGDNRALSFGKPWGDKLGIFVSHSEHTVLNKETYHLVMKFDFGSDECTARMWVNPSAEEEPSEGHVLVERKGPFAVADQVNIQLQGYGHGEYIVDELRIGSSYQSVHPIH